jgi:hypothetical protein
MLEDAGGSVEINDELQTTRNENQARPPRPLDTGLRTSCLAQIVDSWASPSCVQLSHYVQKTHSGY